MEISVNQFINYFGGYDKVIIESQSEIDRVLWNGCVDDWVIKPLRDLSDKTVQTASVIDDKLIIRIFEEV